MTYQEWIEQAEKLEKKMREAYDSGDESLGEMYEIQARSCRANAVYAPGERDIAELEKQ